MAADSCAGGGAPASSPPRQRSPISVSAALGKRLAQGQMTYPGSFPSKPQSSGKQAPVTVSPAVRAARAAGGRGLGTRGHLPPAVARALPTQLSRTQTGRAEPAPHRLVLRLTGAGGSLGTVRCSTNELCSRRWAASPRLAGPGRSGLRPAGRRGEGPREGGRAPGRRSARPSAAGGVPPPARPGPPRPVPAPRPRPPLGAPRPRLRSRSARHAGGPPGCRPRTRSTCTSCW